MNPQNYRGRWTRRAFVGGLAVASTSVSTIAIAQRRVKDKPRIGFLIGDFPKNIAAFLEELRAQGFIHGENVIIETRIQHAGNDGYTLAKELAAMDLEFVVVAALPFALAVRQLNPNMPMVIATCPGMVSNGFARSLERPGGIYTGMDELPAGVTAKRLSLLKTAVPAAKRIALLSTTPGVGGHEVQLDDAQRAAAQLGVTVKAYRATSPVEVDGALVTLANEGADAMLNFQGGLSLMKRQAIVDFATEHRLPAIYQATMFAEAGGLMCWAPDLYEQSRQAARLAAQILRGARPGDLPVTRPEKYFLTINAGTAKKIGLTLPPALLAEASLVIEESV